jgi:hypothetical protein
MCISMITPSLAMAATADSRRRFAVVMFPARSERTQLSASAL